MSQLRMLTDWSQFLPPVRARWETSWVPPIDLILAVRSQVIDTPWEKPRNVTEVSIQHSQSVKSWESRSGTEYCQYLWIRVTAGLVMTMVGMWRFQSRDKTVTHGAAPRGELRSTENIYWSWQLQPGCGEERTISVCDVTQHQETDTSHLHLQLLDWDQLGGEQSLWEESQHSIEINTSVRGSRGRRSPHLSMGTLEKWFRSHSNPVNWI